MTKNVHTYIGLKAVITFNHVECSSLIKGTVSGSGTGPLDFGATGPVPDP